MKGNSFSESKTQSKFEINKSKSAPSLMNELKKIERLNDFIRLDEKDFEHLQNIKKILKNAVFKEEIPNELLIDSMHEIYQLSKPDVSKALYNEIFLDKTNKKHKNTLICNSIALSHRFKDIALCRINLYVSYETF